MLNVKMDEIEKEAEQVVTVLEDENQALGSTLRLSLREWSFNTRGGGPSCFSTKRDFFSRTPLRRKFFFADPLDTRNNFRGLPLRR